MRIDFDMELIDSDKSTNQVLLKLTLNPERYELVEKDGNELYRDKFTDFYFPSELIGKLLEQSEKLQPQYSPHSLDNPEEYFKNRLREIKGYFNKDVSVDEFIANEEENFLEKNINSEMDFVFLSVDIVNSTEISRTLDTSLSSEIKNLFLTEMGLLLLRFNGKVLKYVGDEVLAYFHNPDLLGKTDNAINCASIMRIFVQEVINPFLKSKGFDEIKIRIGIDLGDAKVKKIAIQTGNPSIDILGFTIDLTSKIQKQATPNQILVGESATDFAYTYWRKKLKEIKKPKNWNVNYGGTNKNYRLFSLEDDYHARK